MDSYNLEITDPVIESNEVITINDWYNSSDLCEYTLPVPESDVLHYTVTEDTEEDSKTIYHNISYAV